MALATFKRCKALISLWSYRGILYSCRNNGASLAASPRVVDCSAYNSPHLSWSSSADGVANRYDLHPSKDLRKLSYRRHSGVAYVGGAYSKLYPYYYFFLPL